jgi:hypothetical protein
LTFAVISQEFISTDDDDAIVANLEDRLQKHMAKLEAVKADIIAGTVVVTDKP